MNALPDLVRKHRLTVAEFERLCETGVLDEEARVELIDGELFDMPPIGPEHASVVDDLHESFVIALSGRAIVRGQNPVAFGERSMPQPDLAVLRRRGHRYRHVHPNAADALLVVEVAHSSLEHDRVVKAALYARHGVPEYWLVDVAGRRTTVHRKPSPDGTWGERFDATGPLAPVALPDATLDPTLPFA